MKWRERTTTGPEVRLHLRRVVEPPAPAVLLLHGLGVGGSIWQAFARRLLPELAAVAPDLRGHGQSDAPLSGYAPADYASDLIRLIESETETESASELKSESATGTGTKGPASAEGENESASKLKSKSESERDGDPDRAREGRTQDRRHADSEGHRPAAGPTEDEASAAARLSAPVPVVGHSLGALVALSLADLRPDLVSWLVLLDPPLDPDLPNPEIASVYRLRHAAPGELEAYLLSRNPGGGELLAQSLARLFRIASDAAFEEFLPLRDPNDRTAPSTPLVADDVEGNANQERPNRLAASRQAQRVVQPCLVLQADPAKGGLLGDAAARAFVDRLPNGQLHKIQGATHALHASHPAEVARAILEFYSSVVGSGSR